MRIIPEFIVDDIQKQVAIFCELFGFEVEFTDPEGEHFTWVQLKKGKERIMLHEKAKLLNEIAGLKLGNNSSIIIVFKHTKHQAQKLYQKAKAKKLKMVQDIHATGYGAVEMMFKTDEGILIQITGE